MFRFTIRNVLWLTAVVVLTLALIYVKWPNGHGRYQMTSSGASDPRFILDTATGKIWCQGAYGANWHEYNAPDYGK
jgi:hypothetical protein